MQISERDKKLILILIFVAVAVLPYFLITQKVIDRNKKLADENAKLKDRKEELEGYASNQDLYISESEEMLGKAQTIIARFPTDITQESMLVFYDMIERNIAVEFYQTAFGEDLSAQTVSDEEKQEIRAVEAETGEEDSFEGHIESNTEETAVAADLILIKTMTKFSYRATYEGLKKYLDYIRNYHSRKVITEITAEYKDGTGFIDGTLVLAEYALKGGGRENYEFKPPVYRQGSSNVFLQSSGLDAVEEAERDEDYIADFVITMTGPGSGKDTFVVGKNADAEGDSYVTSDKNGEEDITITFTGSDGEYDAEYSIGKESNADEPVPFHTENVIYLDIMSSPREDPEDKVQGSITIVNASDIKVIVRIKNDPAPPDQRVRLAGNTGKIEVKSE
ncbi:MAG: hypothetical protein K6F53_08850 [Lachnospiraceae bacterium]|nr:hypothetical protein [Lachnospiraceae bacterium]